MSIQETFRLVHCREFAMEAVKAVLFILLTWGVILGAVFGVGIGVYNGTDSWVWSVLAGILTLFVGAVLGEWLSRLANAILYPGGNDDV